MLKTMNRALLAALAVVALATVTPVTAEAQEIQITGPLAGQPAVRHLREYRVGRFFVTPSIGYTLQDEFTRALFFGGSVGYHFTDWLGVSVWGGGAPLNIDTDLTSQATAQGQTSAGNELSLPSAVGFNNQVARIRGAVSAQLLFIPLRGKLSLFQAAFVDTDLYILAGVGYFHVIEREHYLAEDTVCDTYPPSAECRETQQADRVNAALAPMLGLGMTFYINDFLGLQLEWRAFPFRWNPSGTDEYGGEDRQGNVGAFPNGIIDSDDERTTFNHMINVGLTILLPTNLTITE